MFNINRSIFISLIVLILFIAGLASFTLGSGPGLSRQAAIDAAAALGSFGGMLAPFLEAALRSKRQHLLWVELVAGRGSSYHPRRSCRRCRSPTGPS